jgi:hypothetical protein
MGREIPIEGVDDNQNYRQCTRAILHVKSVYPCPSSQFATCYRPTTLKIKMAAQLQLRKKNPEHMNVDPIIAALDAEIEKLNQVRALLGKNDGLASSLGQGKASKPAKAVKRTLSPEARKRIADAQRKRWAATKRKKNSPATP